MVLEMTLHRIVVEKSIVDVEQEYDGGRFGHRSLSCFSSGATSRQNASALGFAEQLFRDLGHSLGFELEFAQQLLQRSRRSECLHADDSARPPADIAFPAKG